MALSERIDAKIVGLEIALECEIAVVAQLEHYRQQFDNNDRSVHTMRGLRQLLDSEKSVKDFQEEIADLKQLAPSERKELEGQ